MDTLPGLSTALFGYTPLNLPGADYPGPDLPTSLAAAGPPGDAGEGSALLAHLGVEQKGRYEPEDAGGVTVNHDSGFTPEPGVLPGEKHLNYARTLTITTLLGSGILLLLVKLARDPKGTVRLVGEGAKRQAGVK
jgi:hypothetical protein